MIRSHLSRLAAHIPRIWLTLATMLTASALPAQAQQPAAPAFPIRPITLIMPFPAGGPSDALGRAVVAKMSSAVGVPVVVENVGGVGGSVGLQKLARAPADGYTIGFGTIGTHAANMILYRKPMYDAVNDHVPLGLVKLDVRSWNGLFAPRGTPPAIVTALNAAILKALADPDLTRQMSAVGVTFPDPATNTPANLADVVRTEIARLRPILLAKNVHID
ncbi:hypothetical protein GCM10007242_35850 [Pigmentiphaga litoralis]|nr:hypothetical protein GCM10007242_35850 [Pigmentiphaga litoralis]